MVTVLFRVRKCGGYLKSFSDQGLGIAPPSSFATWHKRLSAAYAMHFAPPEWAVL